jgi:hypothetical protein
MRHRIEIGYLLLLLTAVSAIPAQAGLVVSVGSTTVAQGGTGALDVYLSSTAPSSSPDQINDYAFTLQITPNSAGNLAFSATQDFGYLNGSNYVFFGNSADYIAGLVSPPPIGGTPFTTVYANDSFLGFDNTNDFTSVSLSSSSGKVLLATLTLDASITSAGESFTVSLVPPSGNGSSSSGSGTYFNVVDSNFNELSSVPFTSTSGTVNIVGASVPEPSSIVSGLTGLLILAGFHAARRVRCSRHVSPERSSVEALAATASMKGNANSLSRSRTMGRRFITLAVLALAPVSISEARVQSKFDHESRTLQRAVAEIVKTVSDLGRKESFSEVAVGLFNDNTNPNNNAGSGLKKLLIEELRKAGIKVVGRGEFIVKGEYSIFEGRQNVEGIEQVFPIAKIAFQVTQRSSKVLFDSEKDLATEKRPIVLNPLDVARLGGVTAFTNPSKPTAENNKKIITGEDGSPDVDVNGSKVRPNNAPYAIEMLVARLDGDKAPPVEAFKPREVTLREGRPFLKVEPGEAIAVRIINMADHDVASMVFIDGLSMYAFRDDKKNNNEYVIIPAEHSGPILGWFRNLEKSDVFLVSELPKDYSDSTLLKNPAEIGSITVSFSGAWENDENRPKDEPSGRAASLEIHQGPPIDAPYKLVKRYIGVLRASITIRYDR